MTYRGHIKNGVAVLDAQIKLPDGTPVQVDIQPSDSDFWRGKNVEETAQEQSSILLPTLTNWPVTGQKTKPSTISLPSFGGTEHERFSNPRGHGCLLFLFPPRQPSTGLSR